MTIAQFITHLGTDGQIALAIFILTMFASLALSMIEIRLYNVSKSYVRPAQRGDYPVNKA